MRSRSVQRETMNKLAAELVLANLLLTSARNVAHNTNMYGDALEALIAAIYLDQGYRVAKKFVFNTLIEKHLDFEDVVKTEIDFKSRLIEWGQKNRLEVRFDLIESYYDSKHNPVFHSNVFVGDIECGDGVGYSKKESHQKASEITLKKIEEDKSFEQKLLNAVVEVDNVEE